MSKANLEEIAKRSGVSKSTVSRVLNNCPGVDGDLREAVIEAVRADYVATAKTEMPADVCIILPDNPKYFWNRINAFLSQNSMGLRIRTYVYSSLTETAVLCDYFERIEQSNIKAVIFAGYAEGEARERLTRLASTRLLIRLCEYDPIPNAFFVGANAYEDGKRLGELLVQRAQKVPARGVVLIRRGEPYNCRLREQGFLEAVGESLCVEQVEAPKDFRLWSSHLARALSGIAERFDYVFCSDGVTVPSCEAIRKLRLGRRIGYFGFEAPQSAEPYLESGEICALIVQDPAEQTRVALSLCKKYLEQHLYPDRKMTYISSKLKTGK